MPGRGISMSKSFLRSLGEAGSLARLVNKIFLRLLKPSLLCERQLSTLEKNVVEELRYRWFVERLGETECVTGADILEAFRRLYGVRNPNLILLDLTYLVPKSRESLLEYLRTDWTEGIRYILDTWDCDNYSIYLASRMRLITGWASTVTLGEVRYEDTWELLGYHAWLTVYYEGGDGLAAEALEPQTDELSRDARFRILEDGGWRTLVYRPVESWPQIIF